MSRSKIQITEEKARKIAIGATVGGVFLIVFLVIVLIIQFVQISVRTSQKKELEEQIAAYEELIESDQQDLDFYTTQAGLYYLARKDGWR